MHIVYLDEFGHIGPFVSREDPRYNDSPVFGIAGFILPANKARDFATWFFKRKTELLAFELQAAQAHPATWEKKGSSLFTTQNVLKYRELRVFTNRLLNKIEACGGHVIYVGLHKQASPQEHKSTRLYLAVLRETVKRLNAICEHDPQRPNFLIVMDQHQEREAIITEVARAMFSKKNPHRRLIEPPFQVESHRYQTVQAADWICGLIGRLGAYGTKSEEFAEFEWAERYFGARIRKASIASGIRSDKRLQSTTLIAENLKEIL